MLSIHTILHPTDFSASSEHAFQLACSLARDHGGRVVVLHVAVPPVVGYRGEIGEQSEGECKALEDRLKQIQPDDPKIPVTHLLEEGDPAAEILRIAKEIKSDLIVMGTQGQTALRRMLMGSVADQVVRHAACPVLTVKLPLPEA